MAPENRFALNGEIDLSTASVLRSALARLISGTSADLLVDCARLTFIDSTGVAVLLEFHQQLEADGRRMLILDVQPGPRRVFEALGLSDLLRSDRETA